MEKVKSKKRNSKTDQQLKRDRIPTWAHLLGLMVIVFLGVFVYSNSFQCSFHFDDKPNILNNVFVRNLSFDNSYYSISNSRLIGNLSFALNYAFGKYDVWGYHFFNLMVHLLTAGFVYGLVQILFSTPELRNHPARKHRMGISMFVALLFVAHPLATQSVTYIVQRLASMVTLFYLSSVFFYVKGRLVEKWSPAKILYFVAACCSALLAFLTKENSFTLPVALLLTEICFFQPRLIAFNRTNYRLFIVLGILLTAGGIGIARFSLDVLKPVPPSFGHTYTLTPAVYLFTQFSVILKYVQLLLVPVNQNLDYDFAISHSLWEPRTLISLAVLLVILAFAFSIFRNHRLASFGILWFFLTLSIESGIVPISDVIFEHRTYLPSFGFLLALVSLGYAFFWSRNPTAAITIVVLMVLTYSTMAYNRNKVWLNEYSLSKDIVSKSPEKSRANSNMALAYVQRGQMDSAIVYFNRAVALNDDYYDAHNNRGITFAQSGRYAEAIADFTRCIELDAEQPRAWCNRGNCNLALGNDSIALSDFEMALRIDSAFSDVYKNRGIYRLNHGNPSGAEEDLRKALTWNPESEELRKLLGIAIERSKNISGQVPASNLGR